MFNPKYIIMKVYNFFFENNIPSRSIVANDFAKAYTALTENEAINIKSVYTTDVTVVD